MSNLVKFVTKENAFVSDRFLQRKHTERLCLDLRLWEACSLEGQPLALSIAGR